LPPGDPALSAADAAELVGLSLDVILATSTPSVAALQQQTRATPIVFVRVSDPVGQGFVQSLARPGGNITGFSAFDAPLMGKWLELLKEVAPRVTRVSIIFNPDTAPAVTFFSRAIEAAAPPLGMTFTLASVHDDAGIEEAIAAQARKPGGGGQSQHYTSRCDHRRRSPSQFVLNQHGRVSEGWRLDVLHVRPG
jgi:putative ABC transport system substrate-binding protein